MTFSDVGQIERKTQDRIIRLFTEVEGLGYIYLGNWEERQDNSNIEEILLEQNLKKRGYSEILIKKALIELKKSAVVQNKSLYDANKEVYSSLRYGVQVKGKTGENKKTVWLIDWKEWKNNDFYIAEEVTIQGQYNKRPDIVLYINGIAIGVLELKRSTISVTEGIRQNLDNQKEIFIRHFFSTIQLVMAGNDTEGLRYATIETPEKFYLTWKEDSSIENKINQGITSKTIAKFYCRPYAGLTAKHRLVINNKTWNIVGDPKLKSINEMELIIQKQEQG